MAATLGGLWLCLWRGPARFWGLPLLAALLVAIWSATTPDLLVSRDGRVFALKDREGRLWLSTGRAERFTADLWLRRAGQLEKLVLGREGELQGGRLRCDPLGCTAETPAGLLAVTLDERGLAEDCGRARLVLTLAYLPSGFCDGLEGLIGRWDLQREGAHAVTVRQGGGRPGGFLVESVADYRGSRPWTRSGRASEGQAAAAGEATDGEEADPDQ